MLKNAEGVKTMRTQDIVLYNYTAVPFCIDRYSKFTGSHIKIKGYNFIVNKSFFSVGTLHH